jgi:transposase-like protein
MAMAGCTVESGLPPRAEPAASLAWDASGSVDHGLYDVATADEGSPNGCGVDEHGADCLCDVDPSRAPVQEGPLRGPEGVLTASDFLRWCERVHDGQEALRGAVRGSARSLVVTVDEARWQISRSGMHGEGHEAARERMAAVRENIRTLLAAGLSARAVARLLAVEPEALFPYLQIKPERAPNYLTIDDAMRTRPRWGYASLAREFGVSKAGVEYWANLVHRAPRTYTPDDMRAAALEHMETHEANETLAWLRETYPDHPVTRGTLYVWRSRARGKAKGHGKAAA